MDGWCGKLAWSSTFHEVDLSLVLSVAIKFADLGHSFKIVDRDRFAQDVLPLYFKHDNLRSFIRQLLQRDVRIEVLHKEEEVFHFWFHAALLPENSEKLVRLQGVGAYLYRPAFARAT